MQRGFKVVSRQKLKRLANEMLKTLRPVPRASLALLSGSLGSGKTTFVQTIAGLLGIREKILSPTFVFIHEHKIRESGKFPFRKLIHIDAYRIETKRDFTSSGISNYLKDPGNLIFVEWGGRVAGWLPKPRLIIEFKHHKPRLRKVRVIPGIEKQESRIGNYESGIKKRPHVLRP